MSKMRNKRKRRKLSKLLKNIGIVKLRKPIAPPTKILPSGKRYRRQLNKEITRSGQDE